MLTLAGNVSDVAEMLKDAVLEDRRRTAPTGDRRRVIETNGVWAPGYPPHLLFTTAVSATPELLVRKKLGTRFVTFMSAIPIDDRELRHLEQGAGAFLDRLASDGLIAEYPRRTT